MCLPNKHTQSFPKFYVFEDKSRDETRGEKGVDIGRDSLALGAASMMPIGANHSTKN